jgi:hypothetical protein
MKNKIKEVQDYFKAKILAGDFEVKKVSNHVSCIVVDGEFEFSIWAYISFGQWSVDNCMYLGEFTEEEQKKGLDIFKKIIEGDRLKKLKSEKLKQFNEMKKELEEAGLLNKEQ